MIHTETLVCYQLIMENCQHKSYFTSRCNQRLTTTHQLLKIIRTRGKTQNKHRMFANPHFSTLRNPKGRDFIWLQGSEKLHCARPGRKEVQSLRLPRPQGAEGALCSRGTSLGQGPEPGAGQAQLLPHLSACTRKPPTLRAEGRSTPQNVLSHRSQSTTESKILLCSSFSLTG